MVSKLRWIVSNVMPLSGDRRAQYLNSTYHGMTDALLQMQISGVQGIMKEKFLPICKYFEYQNSHQCNFLADEKILRLL